MQESLPDPRLDPPTYLTRRRAWLASFDNEQFGSRVLAEYMWHPDLDGAPAAVRERSPAPGDWNEARAWVLDHQHLVELIVSAGNKPVFGLPLKAEAVPGTGEAWIWNRTDGFEVQDIGEQAPLAETLLPHIGVLRSSARLIGSDLRVQAEEPGFDRAKAVDRFESMLRLADNATREFRVMLAELVRFSIVDRLLGDVIIAVRLGAFDAEPDSLGRIAEAIGSVDACQHDEVAAFERLMFDDMRLRVHEHHGRGLITPLGGAWMGAWGDAEGPVVAPVGFPDTLDTPELRALAERTGATGRANSDAYREAMERHIQRMTEPAWLDRAPDSTEVSTRVFERVAELEGALLLAEIFMPALDNATEADRKHRMQTSAALLELSARLHLLRHGVWPGSPGEIDGDLRHGAPWLDLHTGQTLGYVLGDHGPVIYSFGADRDDDGGRPGAPERHVILDEDGNVPGDAPDGDWVIFPRAE
ncbi:MAG: hypothetical protein AAF356_02970 [Planctomycetota bacterium]